MKQLIILILILILNGCYTIPCEQYYFFSEQHLNISLLEIKNYKVKYVNDRLYTGQADTKVAYDLYLNLWPDAKITYFGCPDTLIFDYESKNN